LLSDLDLDFVGTGLLCGADDPSNIGLGDGGGTTWHQSPSCKSPVAGTIASLFLHRHARTTDAEEITIEAFGITPP
jgi:hypothetical protein